MTHDPLRDLLTGADAAADVAPRPGGDLARRVRHEARRRQTRSRIAGGTAAATIAVLIAALLLPTRSRKHDVAARNPSPAHVEAVTPKSPTGVAELTATLARLRAEAETRELTVAAMLERESNARRPAVVPQASDPLERIRAQQDLGALAIVRQADRRYHELDRKDAAAAAYGRVVTLFPNTPGAAVARQRLLDIGG